MARDTMHLEEPPQLASRRSAPARRWALVACLLLAFARGQCGRAADVTAVLAQPPTDSNNLRRLTAACSRYCEPGVNGLDLWVSLKEVRREMREGVERCGHRGGVGWRGYVPRWR